MKKAVSLNDSSFLFKFCNKVILETENVKIGINQDNAGVKANIVLNGTKCAM